MKKQKIDSLNNSIIDRFVELLNKGEDFEIDDVDKFFFRLIETLQLNLKKEDLIIALSLRQEFWMAMLANIAKYRELIAYVFQYISFYSLPSAIQKELESRLGITILKILPYQFPQHEYNKEVDYSCNDMDIIYAKSTIRRFATNNFNAVHRQGPSYNSYDSAYYEIVFYPQLEGMITGKVNGRDAFLCTQSFVTPRGDCFIYGVNYNLVDTTYIDLENVNNRLGKFMHYYEDIMELCQLVKNTKDIQTVFYLLSSIYDKLVFVKDIPENYSFAKGLRELIVKLHEFLASFSINQKNKRILNIISSIENSLNQYLSEVIASFPKDSGLVLSVHTDTKRIIIHSLADQLKWRVSRQIKFYDEKKRDSKPLGEIVMDLSVSPVDPSLGLHSQNTLPIDMAISSGYIPQDIFEA